MAKIQKGDVNYNAIKAIMDRNGIPEYVWWPIVLQESRGNINAVGDNGTSFGLFQIHGNFSEAEKQRLLTDAVYNAQKALALWKARPIDPWQFASSKAPYPSPEFVAYFWIDAQRPKAWTVYNDTKRFTDDMKNIMKYASGENNSDTSGNWSNEEGSLNGLSETDFKWYNPLTWWESIINWFKQNLINVIIGLIAFILIILIIYSMVKGD